MFWLFLLDPALGESPGTIELTSSNYGDHVTGPNRYAFFIKVYNPHCAHCSIFKPFWEKFALTTAAKHNSVHLGEINCNEQQKLCRKMPCNGYPCLIWSNGIDPTDLLSVAVVYDTEKLATVFDALISTPVHYLEKRSDLQNHRDSGIMFLLNYATFDDPLCNTFYLTSLVFNETKFSMMRSNSFSLEIIYYGKSIGKMKDSLASVSQLEEAVKRVLDRTFPFLDEFRVTEFLKSPNKFILMIIDKTDSMANYTDLARVIPSAYDNAWAFSDSPALDRIVTGIQPGDTYPVLIEYNPADEGINRYSGKSFGVKEISEWLNITFIDDIDHLETPQTAIPLILFVIIAVSVVAARAARRYSARPRIDEGEELPLAVFEEEEEAML